MFAEHLTGIPAIAENTGKTLSTALPLAMRLLYLVAAIA
jgi:hypothetical protein